MKDLITTAQGFRARCNSPENLDSTRKKLDQALQIIDALLALPIAREAPKIMANNRGTRRFPPA